MKTLTTLAMVGASVLALSAGSASAQSMRYDGHYDGRYDSRHDGRHDGRYEGRHDRWMSINGRQAELERRIERGIARGEITRREAFRLRAEFRQVVRMEARYRMNGLSNWERADLDRRFDRLAAQIRWERRDNEYGYGYGRDYHR